MNRHHVMDARCRAADRFRGSTVRLLRKRIGQTQAAMGHDLGLTGDTIARLETTTGPIGRLNGLAMVGLMIAHRAGLSPQEWMRRGGS